MFSISVHSCAFFVIPSNEMSSSKLSALESDAHKGQTTSKRHAPAQDSEEAPLLVDGAIDDDVEANGAATAKAPPSKTETLKGRSLHVWHWIHKNLTVVAVACLLLAGIIALCAYFAGERGSFSYRKNLR